MDESSRKKEIKCWASGFIIVIVMIFYDRKVGEIYNSVKKQFTIFCCV